MQSQTSLQYTSPTGPRSPDYTSMAADPGGMSGEPYHHLSRGPSMHSIELSSHLPVPGQGASGSGLMPAAAAQQPPQQQAHMQATVAAQAELQRVVGWQPQQRSVGLGNRAGSGQAHGSHGHGMQHLPDHLMAAGSGSGHAPSAHQLQQQMAQQQQQQGMRQEVGLDDLLASDDLLEDLMQAALANKPSFDGAALMEEGGVVMM